MKKFRSLSLYRKKKASENDEIPETSESEPPARSPSKSPFAQTLKRKFFSGKSFQRSQSMPENNASSLSPAFSPSAVQDDIFTDDTDQFMNGHYDSPETSEEIRSGNFGDYTASPQQRDSKQAAACYHVPDTKRHSCAGDANLPLKAKNGHSKSETNRNSDPAEDFSPTKNNTGTNESKDESDPTLVNHDTNRKSSHSSYADNTEIDHNDENHSSVCDSPDVDPTVLTHNDVAYCRYKHTLTAEFKRLAQQGWYWGPLTRMEAEEKLFEMVDGSFLVRDSSDERYLLSLSFRSFGRTLHTRIEHSRGRFSFYVNSGNQSYSSVVDLIMDSVRDSQESGVFCYSRSRSPLSPTMPVRLTNPISRLSQVRSLQYLCRFVIRQYTRIDHIEKLPLPNPVKGYLTQSYF